jgi:MFS family permease
VKKNIKLLYGFSFFDQFMIVIAVWVPYLAMQGIGMRQFMELQAVFALVILCGEVPSGLLSDLWGRKKTLLLGATLKASAFPSSRCGAATRASSSTTSRWGSPSA